jgi:hypothetical protein
MRSRGPHALRHDQEATRSPELQRNATLTSLAGQLQNAGLSVDELKAALLSVNQTRCRPPLDPSEVERIAVSVSRYTPTPISQGEDKGEFVMRRCWSAATPEETT